MKSDDTPMYDDPSESAFVRELLQAGRRANVEYDVERGLAKHLATISAGSTAPYWVAGATAAKRSVPLWVGYVTLPLVAAGVAGMLWVFSARPETTPTAPAETSEAAAPAEALAIEPAADDREEAVESKQAERVSGSDRRGARPIARLSSPAPARAARSGASARGPSEAPAVAVAEGIGAAPSRGGDAPDGVASNPYSGSASASARDPQSSAAVQNSAAPRVPEPLADRVDESAEEPEAQREEESVRPAKQQAAAHRPVVDESRLEREMQMLAVTQRVLASDPERALRLSEQGEREFPGTMFSAERRQLGLLALVKLGRLDEARREGRPFLARYPRAPWSERLRRALATGQVD